MLRPAKLDKRLARELKGLADAEDPYDTVTGKTMCTNDFYEGQGRLDGAFCDYGEQEKMEYLNKLADFGEKEKDLLTEREMRDLTYFNPLIKIKTYLIDRSSFQAWSTSRWRAPRLPR